MEDLGKFGFREKPISLTSSFHDDMVVLVQENGDVSEPFPVPNSVKQGRVLTSTSSPSSLQQY